MWWILIETEENSKRQVKRIKGKWKKQVRKTVVAIDLVLWDFMTIFSLKMQIIRDEKGI